MSVVGYHDDKGRLVLQRDYRCPENGTPHLCEMCHFPGRHRVEFRVLIDAKPPLCPDHGPMVPV